MIDIPAALSGLKQLTPTMLLGIVLTSGLLLFLNDDLLSQIGLDAFRRDKRTYIGGAFILSLGLWLAHFLASTWRWIKGLAKFVLNKWGEWTLLRKRRKMLHKLTPAEKHLLAPYILQEVNTRYFHPDNGVSGGLVAKSVLYLASTTGDFFKGTPYNMQPWAREYLNEHQELLNGAAPDPNGTGERSERI